MLGGRKVGGMEGEGDEVRRREELEALEAIYGEMFTLGG